MKPLKLAAILAVFCLALFFTIKIALWSGTSTTQAVLPVETLSENTPTKVPAIPINDNRTDENHVKKVNNPPIQEVKEPIKTKNSKREKSNRTNDVTTKELIEANIPAAETLEDLKKQLVETYNINSWSGCKKIIRKSKELKKYQHDLEYIFHIRQNEVFDAIGGFKNPKLSPDQILNLQAFGFVSGDNEPTDRFNIKNLEDLARLRKELEDILNYISNIN